MVSGPNITAASPLSEKAKHRTTNKFPLWTWMIYFCIQNQVSVVFSSYFHFFICIFFWYLLCTFFRYSQDNIHCGFTQLWHFVMRQLRKSSTIRNEWALFFKPWFIPMYAFWPGTSAPPFFSPKHSWKFSSSPLPNSRNETRWEFWQPADVTVLGYLHTKNI